MKMVASELDNNLKLMK